MNAVYAMRDVCNVCARACIQKESNISEASYMQPQTHSREKTRKKLSGRSEHSSCICIVPRECVLVLFA